MQDGSGGGSGCGALLQTPSSVFLLQNGTDALLLQDGSGDCGGGATTLTLDTILPFESLDTPLFDLYLSTILPLESKGWLEHGAKLPLESKGWLQPSIKLPFESGGVDSAAVEVLFDIFRALNSPIPAFFDIVSNLPAPEPISVEFDIFEGVASASVSFDIFSEKMQDARCADVQMPIAKWEIF